ncbi:prolyl oligopeptidase family serine peptidase [Streptomyces sp. T12]|uniref:alpha/beta hydrolase family protein n=2 Tax=unclassified Streptomyces TaxID=2593676 RepID=UPI0023671BA5|nr:prolyl oligopeptidase family serine peptidase [Streptomyces sp. T12]WDF41779.1 prolyl oligopeptidase family serine peptidase [Streptomyces sp. T12]
MPPEPLGSAVLARPGGAAHDTVLFRPDLSVWAVLGSAERPSVADHNPRTVHWRDLPVDPGLAGVAPARARHADVVIGGVPGSPPWRLPLRTVLSAGLAWHPRLPLVAGLVQQGEGLHPWSADYATRRLTVHQRVRAALSLLCRRPGRSVLAWCSDGQSALLALPALVATGPPDEGGQDRAWSPMVYEAAGPGHVAFVPGHAELLRLAGASVSVVDPVTGALRTLTPPLLVGGLESSPSGRRLLVEHSTAADSGPAQRPPGPGDGLVWSRAVLRTDSGSWAAVPATTRWATGHDGDTTAASTVVAGGTAIELHTLPDGEGPPAAEERVATAGLTVTHEVDDPPVWWHCLTVGGEPAVVSRHRASLRLRTGADDLRVALPRALGRLGPAAAGPDAAGVVISCVLDGRAGFLRLDRGEPVACIAVEPPGEGDDAPLEASWATVEDGVPRLITRRAGRFARHELCGLRLDPAHGTVPPPVCPAPSRTRGRAAPPAHVLAPPPGGESPRLTHVDGPAPGARAAAQLLWIQVRRSTGTPTGGTAVEGGAAADGGAPVHLTGLRSRTWLLDLPLMWTADVRPDAVRQQIVHAVDQAVAILRERPPRGGPVVVGGHSFAATVALHALAHCPSLAGAIAHSGCYNRTLTPEGFQYERRSYWQVPELYRAFSALDFADRLTRPVLLVHGLDDTNAATPPDQAVALYRAVVATGGRGRLVLLPYEGHNFRHRESLETVAREHDAWLAACVALSDHRAESLERT